MLGLDEARTSGAWPWNLSVQGPLSPADAIAAVFSATSGVADTHSGIGPPVLVVPNDLREWAQAAT